MTTDRGKSYLPGASVRGSPRAHLGDSISPLAEAAFDRGTTTGRKPVIVSYRAYWRFRYRS